MSEFVRVCKAYEIPDPGKQVIEVDGRFVLLCRVGGQFYAIDDCCTHDQGPLGEGVLEGLTIVCPRHGAKFDVRDGRALCLPATQATAVHEVRVDGADVFVKLAD